LQEDARGGSALFVGTAAWFSNFFESALVSRVQRRICIGIVRFWRVGRFGGQFKGLRAQQLGTIVVKELVGRTGLHAQNDGLTFHDSLARGRIAAGGENFPVPGGMLETVENLRRDYAISRSEQDQFACQSHRKAVAAQDSGVANTRADTTVDSLSALRLILKDATTRTLPAPRATPTGRTMAPRLASSPLWNRIKKLADAFPNISVQPSFQSAPLVDNHSRMQYFMQIY
jgi:acetyl-CoA acetyltransferase